jgi:hypothetical protein
VEGSATILATVAVGSTVGQDAADRLQVQALGTAADRLATLHDWARAVGTSLGYASSANLLVRYLKHGRPHRPSN